MDPARNVNDLPDSMAALYIDTKENKIFTPKTRADGITDGTGIDLNQQWDILQIDNRLRTIEQLGATIEEIAGQGSVLAGIEARVAALEAQVTINSNDINVNAQNIQIHDEEIRTLISDVNAIKDRLDAWEPYCLRSNRQRTVQTEWLLSKLTDGNLGWNFLYFLGTGGNYFQPGGDTERFFTGDLIPVPISQQTVAGNTYYARVNTQSSFAGWGEAFYQKLG